MSILLAEVRPYGFAPVTGWDDEQRAKYPIGAVVHLKIVLGRTPKMHRFYWALIEHIAGGIGYNKYNLSDELLTSTGFIESWTAKDGTIHVRPKRISEMGHVEFKDYFDAAIELICAKYIAEMSVSSLLSEVERMLNISYTDAFTAPKKKGKSNAVQH